MTPLRTLIHATVYASHMSGIHITHVTRYAVINWPFYALVHVLLLQVRELSTSGSVLKPSLHWHGHPGAVDSEQVAGITELSLPPTVHEVLIRSRGILRAYPSSTSVVNWHSVPSDNVCPKICHRQTLASVKNTRSGKRVPSRQASSVISTYRRSINTIMNLSLPRTNYTEILSVIPL